MPAPTMVATIGALDFHRDTSPLSEDRRRDLRHRLRFIWITGKRIGWLTWNPPGGGFPEGRESRSRRRCDYRGSDTALAELVRCRAECALDRRRDPRGSR